MKITKKTIAIELKSLDITRTYRIAKICGVNVKNKMDLYNWIKSNAPTEKIKNLAYQMAFESDRKKMVKKGLFIPSKPQNRVLKTISPYIPKDKIVGLSKLARTVDFYANRFQNQERITTQIAEKIQKELNPLGVAVTLKAQHLCICMRGVKKNDTWTQTSKMIGVFKTDLNCRNEFLSLIK